MVALGRISVHTARAARRDIFTQGVRPLITNYQFPLNAAPRLVSTHPFTRSFTSKTISNFPSPLLRRPYLYLAPKAIISPGSRGFASRAVDEHLNEIEHQYELAMKSYQLAVEETAIKSVYAAEDREAAHTSLDLLIDMYEDALEELGDGDEMGGRIRAEWDEKIVELEELVGEFQD